MVVTRVTRLVPATRSEAALSESSALDDALGRLADGDRAAFDVVFDSLWPILKRYCERALGPSGSAEDAAQRALLKMFEQAAHYDRKRPALGWALSFAFWECRTEKTKLRRGRTGSFDEELASDEESQEDELGRRQWELAARGLIEELTPEERALIGADVEPELAQILAGCSPEVIRKRRQRLLTKLRDAFRTIVSGDRSPS